MAGEKGKPGASVLVGAPADPDLPWRPLGPWRDDFPTHGHHVNVWGYLFELIAADSPLELQNNERLRDVDAGSYSKRSVWPAALIHSAFIYMVQQQLVLVQRTGGQAFASAAFDRLIERLHHERRLEHENQAESAAYRALSYFRARHFHVRVPWLDRVMREVDRAALERVVPRGGDRASS